MRDYEHQEQVELINRLQTLRPNYPELGLLFAIPNGGKRPIRAAMKMAAEGQMPGVPDLFLPVARRGKHGFFIEFKRADRRDQAGKLSRAYPSKEQKIWLPALRNQGYEAMVSRGVDETIENILNYTVG